MDVHEQISKCKEFIEAIYKTQLHNVSTKGRKSLIIDFQDIITFSPELADFIIESPEDGVIAMEQAIESFDLGIFKARFHNLPSVQFTMIRDIRSSHLGKFIYTEGLVRQSSDIRPQVTIARFECPSCGNILTMPQLETKFKEPSRCSCGRRGKFRMLSKELVDAQRIVLEEIPELLEGGEQPKRIPIFLKEDLVEPVMEKKTTPGSKVRVFGIIKEIPIPLSSGGQSTRYDLMIESNFILPLEETFGELEISEEDKKQILELSKSPTLFEDFTASTAPSIYGHNRIKEALVLQLMGGVKKTRPDGTKTRGDMHILLVGDPGTAKSSLISSLAKVAPKSRLTGGKSASGAGLTAAVVKDEFLKGWALEAGAIVLANGGYLFIDELDKMSTEDRNALHEALEQQRISISKANIQACYSSDTEVLTEKGWKKYNEVNNLKIAQFYPKDKKIKFLNHKGLYVYNNKESMYWFKNKRNDILITPKHTMLAKEYSQKEYQVIKAEDLKYSYTRFLNSGNYEAEGRKYFILPGIKHKQNRTHEKYTQQETGKNIPMELWLEFLGYYLSEGGIQREFSIGIPQKKGKNADKIRICLKKLSQHLGFTLTESKDGKYYTRFQITNTQLFKTLVENCGKNCYTKKNPMSLADLSKEQLEIFFNALMLGDGSKEGREFSSTSENLADEVQAIACLIGKSASKNIAYKARGNRKTLYRITLSDKTTPSIRRKYIQKKKYEGEVFCFATESGFFITRRNGKIAIQGNTLKAETTVLAAANPKLSRFDPYTPIASQIDLPASLINRFDLVFPIRDIPNREVDEKIASHVLSIHKEPETIQPKIPANLYKRYISYAKQHIFPKLGDKAMDEIKEFYVNLRNSNTGTGEEIKPIPISARQLEALIRLAEGSARLRLSSKVTRNDAKRAIELLRYCLMQVGFDKETGQFDIDKLYTGLPTSTRTKIITVREIINDLEKKIGKNIPIENIMKEALEHGLEENKVEEYLNRLRREGEIFEPKQGIISKTSK